MLTSTELKNCHAHRSARIWRVVETQEIAATRAITRSQADQARLEVLLEQSKPTVPTECAGLSYLLFTPFRYPPLDYGSRFGTRWQRGIFYGSSERRTAFAEAAVYLWLFQSGPVAPGPLAQIRDQRTIFAVTIKSDAALDLCLPIFANQRGAIADPADWSATQQLGSRMRQAGTAFCLYPSARLAGGQNGAIFDPSAFAGSEPEAQQHWHCRLDERTCWFGRRQESFEFQRGAFERGGVIPHPALSGRRSERSSQMSDR